MSNKSTDFDILIIGSGPSGANAAQEAVKSGLKVGLVEIGFTDDKYQQLIPEQPFSIIRNNDKDQAKYFLGEDPAQAFQSQAKAGAHLTPPRQHMVRDMERLFPTESDNFLPLQSTAHGGLGVSWGSNVFAFEDFELERIGLPVGPMRKFYADTSAAVGVSGPQSGSNDDLFALISNLGVLEPPLELDTNSSVILKRYQNNRGAFLGDGFFLGQSVLAVLSQGLGAREANPYWDMDFWSDHRKSVYRPKFTIAELGKAPGFFHVSGKLAERFEESSTDGGVRVYIKDVYDGARSIITCRRLILAAGAINSGKLALSSCRDYETKIPILCNPNHWVAAINLQMLGRAAQDRRYSLAQLTALLRTQEDDRDYVLGQFYSYRSLLYSRLLSNLPLPPKVGLTFLRLLMTSFTCVNLHFSDRPAPHRWLKIRKDGERDVLLASYSRTESEERALRANERCFVRKLIRLGLIPMGINRPAHGASIHYAGTLPYCDEDKPLTCDQAARLRGTNNVYVGDGASWRFLPAKGLTFTLMANARRVAAAVVRGLKT